MNLPLLLIVVLLSVHTISALQADCSSLAGCENCIKSTECGFCQSTNQCLPGNTDGPANNNTVCLIGWKHGSCSGCPLQTDCWGCNEVTSEQCKWCASGCVSFSNACTGIGDCRSQCGQQTTCSSCHTVSQCQWCLESNTEKCLSLPQSCAKPLSICTNTVLPQFLAGLLTPLVVAIAAGTAWYFYKKSQDTGQLFKEDTREH